MPPRRQSKSELEKKKLEKKEPWNILWMHGNAKWHEACAEVLKLLRTEPPVDAEGNAVNFKVVSDRQKALDIVSVRYLNYIKVYHKLNECLPWLVHPQKRSLLRKCVEALAGRICELKHEMMELDLCLYQYFDDLLPDMGLTPDDLIIKVPSYFLQDRYNVLRMREHILDMMVEKMKEAGDDEPRLSDVWDWAEEKFEQDDSSGKHDSTGSRDSSQEDPAPIYSTKIPGRPPPVCKPVVALANLHFHGNFVSSINKAFNEKPAMAIKIIKLQSWWRVWLCRQKANKLRYEEDVALGMQFPKGIPLLQSKEKEEYNRAQKMYKERQQELEVSKTIEHERFMAAHGHNMAWELKYNITQWLLELRDLQGTFPNYPEEEEGGCERLFSMKTVEEVDEEIKEMLDPNPQQPEKPKPEPAKKPVPEEIGWKPAPTGIIPALIENMKEYNSYWYLKDEMDNVEQRFDRQLMLEQVREDAGKQIRLQVDELMRYELDKLRCGIEFEEMPNRNVKPKPKVEPKEKVTKDPLAHKTVEDLYMELVTHEIVIPVDKVTMDDYLGGFNIVKEVQETCIPAAADIRNMLTQLVILPMSSAYLHSTLPLVNRMLFAGPKGTGKKMLVHALCRAIGANLMDISPENLAAEFMGPERQEYLMNALLKVGKSMEPTIFLVGDCDILYTRYNPKEPHPSGDRLQRWAPVWPKMMNKMKQGDRMMIIGTTKNPFYCNNYAMMDLFRKVVYMPPPDYSSRVLLWNEFLQRMPVCKYARLNANNLAKLSEGCSASHIAATVQNVLNAKRLKSFKPLTNMELIRYLILHTDGPIDEDEWIAWEEWHANTPLMKRRTQMLIEEEEALLLV